MTTVTITRHYSGLYVQKVPAALITKARAIIGSIAIERKEA